jgi:serine/threonine protein kinase
MVGMGTYGEVLLAMNKSDGELCVIKLIAQQFVAKVKSDKKWRGF